MVLKEHQRREYIDCLNSIRHGCTTMGKPFSKDIIQKTFGLRDIKVEFIKSNDTSGYDIWVSENRYGYFAYLTTLKLE